MFFEEMLVEREHCQKKAQKEDLIVERDQGNQKKAHWDEDSPQIGAVSI